MKTVKAGEEIRRVSDAEAHALVEQGKAEYCPKAKYKAIRDFGKSKAVKQ